MHQIKQLLAMSSLSALAAFGLAACGDSDDDGGGSGAAVATAPASTPAPEERIAPDAQVSAGLRRLARVAGDVSDQTATGAAKRAAGGLEPIWKDVEGTVKRNEPELYATIEEDLSLLESGEAAKTATGSEELAATVKAYLAKHPG